MIMVESRMTVPAFLMKAQQRSQALLRTSVTRGQ